MWGQKEEEEKRRMVTGQQTRRGVRDEKDRGERRARRMSGLRRNGKSNTGHEGAGYGGHRAASGSFRECDFNVSLIKSEAVPIIHTLLQRSLSPHALLHSRG